MIQHYEKLMRIINSDTDYETQLSDSKHHVEELRWSMPKKLQKALGIKDTLDKLYTDYYAVIASRLIRASMH